jgi:hypothetical protein
MQLYEANGELVAVTTKKTKLKLRKSTTYEEYLSMPAARDMEATVPLNLSTAITGNSEDKVTQAFAENSEATDAQAASNTGSRPQDAAGSSLPRSGAKGGSSKDSSSSRFTFSGMGLSRKSKSCQGSTATSDRSKAVSSRACSQADSDAAGGSDPVRVQVAGTGRTVRARMWLTQDAPINQKQLLPLLEIAGSTNQYILKVSPLVFALEALTL